MKQILIRKPNVDITLKRVGNIGYIFYQAKDSYRNRAYRRYT